MTNFRSLLSAVLLGALGAGLGACTSGATPDCDGGVCGYTVPDTGAVTTEDGGGDGSAPDGTLDVNAIDSSLPSLDSSLPLMDAPLADSPSDGGGG